jgi:hypothetical protein
MENNNLKESVGQNEETVCGPGCDCSKPPANNKMRITVGLIIVLIAAGIFAYKIIKPKPSQEPPETYAGIADGNNTNITPPAAEQPNIPSVKEPKTQKKTYIGEYLDAFSSLNTVAADQDAVFILIPANEKETVSRETETAIQGTQRALKTNGVNTGVYTLRTSAPEYQSIKQQVSPPAILIACKGRGMNAVPVDGITETKLLQTYVGVSQAGGCGAGSTCGPSNQGCK